MAANINAAEDMRELVLTKVPEILRLFPAGAVLEVDWDPAGEDYLQDFEQFLNFVQQHFAGRRDGAGNTVNRLAELVPSFMAGEILRSRLHAEVCLLLIGHADLFNRFERLRLMNDGREETRRKIRKLEHDVRYAAMFWINWALARCRSATVNLNRTPVTLDRRDLEFIATVCFTSDDPTAVAAANARFRRVKSLLTEPTTTSVRAYFSPTLRDKNKELRRVELFLSSYFVGVVSTAI